MGRPEKYEPAHRQLRRLLAEAREEGLNFGDAWKRAVRPDLKPIITTKVAEHLRPEGCVVWPADTRDRHLILMAVLTGEEGWRRCYYREPSTPAELALVRLSMEVPFFSDALG